MVTTHNISDPVNPTEVIQTLQDYLMAGMMQAYPNSTAVVTVTLEASPDPSNSNIMDYTGSINFFNATAKAMVPSFEDVQAVAQALILHMATVQAAVDANPDVTQSQNPTARVEQIIAGDMSAAALSNFTIVVTTNDTSVVPVHQAQLMGTLEQYLTASMMEKYPNSVEVTLRVMTSNNSGGQSSGTAVDYSGYVVFSDATPPSFQDVQAWQQELMLDLTAVQEAVDDNPAIGQDVQVKHVAVGGSGVSGLSKSAVALTAFTMVVNTSDNDDAVDQAQLTITLQDYLLAGNMEVYPSVVGVSLVGDPNQMDPLNAVEYTGFIVFSSIAPPVDDVQAKTEEILLDWAALQSAVNGNPAIGQNLCVRHVALDESGGEVVASTSVVALSDFSMIVASDGADAINDSELTNTLEDYLTASMMEEYTSGDVVTLDGSQTQIDGSEVFDYTGYVTVCNTAPPSAGEVILLGRDLMLDMTDVQAAVDAELGIGSSVRIQQVVVGDDSVVALSDFTIAIQSDDLNTVNQSELANTLEHYLLTGLMREFPDVEAVALQPQQTQRDDTTFFSGHAMFVGSAPDLGEVQSNARGLLRDTRAVQTAVDTNQAIGENVIVSGVESVGDVDDNDDSNTAKIVGGVVGASAFCIALAVIFMARGRTTPESDDDNEEAPLASTAPLLPSGVASKSQQDAAATVSD
jgi:hypothetical protein